MDSFFQILRVCRSSLCTIVFQPIMQNSPDHVIKERFDCFEDSANKSSCDELMRAPERRTLAYSANQPVSPITMMVARNILKNSTILNYLHHTMADQDEASVYIDLIGFLKSERADVRLSAIEAVLAVKDWYVLCFIEEQCILGSIVTYSSTCLLFILLFSWRLPTVVKT
jgi:hypothetical protein